MSWDQTNRKDRHLEFSELCCIMRKNGTDRHLKVLAKSGFILTFTVNHNDRRCSQMKNGRGAGETQSKSSR